MTRLRATSGRTTVSPPTAAAVAASRAGGRGGAPRRPAPRLRSEVRSAAECAASAGARPDAGAGRGDRVRRIDLGEQGLEVVDAVLVLVQDVGQLGVGARVGDGVDGAPGGQGGHRHLRHQRQRLVAVEGAGEQVGRLDEEGERAAAQPLQLGEAGAFDGERDAVGGELEAQGLLVRVPARGLGGDAERAGEPALDLERDGDHGAHAGAGQQRHRARHDGEVLVDGGHPGRAVPPAARLDGDAGEALAGGGQAGGGAYLQLGLVVGGQQQIGGVAVEHVAGAFDGALEQSVEVVGGGGADEDLEGVGRRTRRLSPAAGGVACEGTRSGRLQDGALVVADEQADRGGLAVAVPDAQVGGVDGDGAAVGAAHAVGALPAGELERLGDAGAGAGGVRPGGEVGERLADDLLGGVAEEFLCVLVPGGDRRRRGRPGRRRRGRGCRRRAARRRAGRGRRRGCPRGARGGRGWNQTRLSAAV